MTSNSRHQATIEQHTDHRGRLAPADGHCCGHHQLHLGRAGCAGGDRRWWHNTQAAYTVSPAQYGEVLAQRKDSTSHCYHFDGLGSTTELTDVNEAETDSFRYKAFGEALSTSGATQPPFQYVGKLGYYRHPDTEIGLDYVRARWYRSRIGRFISPDPLLTLGSPYPYATNNPGEVVDVSGMQPFTPALPTN